MCRCGLHVSLDEVGDTKILGRHRYDFRYGGAERGRAIIDEEEILLNQLDEDSSPADCLYYETEGHDGSGRRRATLVARWVTRFVSCYRRWSRWWLGCSVRWRTAICRGAFAIACASIVTALAPVVWRYRRDEVIAAAWCVFTVFVFATLYAPMCREPHLPRRLQRDWVG